MRIFERIKESLSYEHVRLFWLFAGLEATFWIAVSVGNYFTVYMQEQEFSTSTIGIVNSVISAVGIFASLFWGMISDRIGSIKRVVIIILIGSSILLPFVPIAGHIKFAGISLAVVVGVAAFFFRNPAGTLVDNWTVRGCNSLGLNYGSVRSCGSFAFAVVGMALSFILPTTGVECTFYISPILMVFCILICFRIKYGDGERGRAKKQEGMKIGSLFKNYYYVTYLIFYVGLLLATSSNYSFIPMLLKGVGASGAQMGLVTGYRALLEIPMLMLLRPLRRKFPLYVLIIGGGVMFALESLLLGFAGALWQLILFTTFSGLANGLLIAGGANYVLGLAPEGLKATAQTVVVSAASLSGIVGNACGGFVIEALGVSMFYRILGCLIAFVTLFYIASFVFGKRVLKKEIPNE